MGCFARTCGISNTGVNEGESVVVIVFKQPSPKGIELYEVLQGCSQQLAKIKSDKKKTFEDKLGFQYITTDFRSNPIDRVLHGDYNDYGWIDGDDTEPDYEYESTRHLVFHTWAVEHILGKKISEIEMNIEIGISIIQSLYYLRRSPIDWMLGQQHPDIGEMKEQLALNEATNEYLKKKIKEYQDEDEED